MALEEGSVSLELKNLCRSSWRLRSVRGGGGRLVVMSAQVGVVVDLKVASLEGKQAVEEASNVSWRGGS